MAVGAVAVDVADPVFTPVVDVEVLPTTAFFPDVDDVAAVVAPFYWTKLLRWSEETWAICLCGLS